MLGSKAIEQLQSNTQEIDSKSSQAKKVFQDTITNIKPLQDTLNQIDSKYLSKYIDFVSHIHNLTY